MNNISEKITDFTSLNAFGVCTYLGNKLGIGVDKVRAYFIYASFATLGSSVLIYLVLSFGLEFRKLLRRGRSRIWDI